MIERQPLICLSLLLLLGLKAGYGAEYFCLEHFGGKFLTSVGGRIVLTSQCRSQFTHLSNKALQLANSDLCLEPLGTANNVMLVVKKGCGVTAGFDLTPNLKHLATGKCIHTLGGPHFPGENHPLVLHDGCTQPQTIFRRSQVHYCIQHVKGLHLTVREPGKEIIMSHACVSPFTILPNGALRLVNSDLCIEPSSNNNNAAIVVKRGCAANAVMQFTAKGSLRHKATGSCFHPKGGSIDSPSGTLVVLHTGCDETRLRYVPVSENLALRKPTFQSGTGWGGSSYFAVDGNADPHFGAKSCTASPAITNTWWRVDLLSSQSVCMVKVTNRGDCCSDRLNYFEVRVGNIGSGDGSKNPICNTVSLIGRGETKTVFCKNAVVGRFVYIRLQRKNILTLCEVQVFGSCFCSPRPGKLKNLALGKPTTQIDNAVNAKTAVDGNLNTVYGAGSCTHTALRDRPWWRVDLQKSEEVCMVAVTNRGDCCGARLSNFEIWVGSNGGGDGSVGNTLCQYVNTVSAGQTRTIICEKPVKGRYVFIRLKGRNWLTLCEVQVYGTTLAAPVIPAVPTTAPPVVQCTALSPPKNGMIVQTKDMAVALCKKGTYPSSLMSAYFTCSNGVWLDTAKKQVAKVPDCARSHPMQGMVLDIFKHWRFIGDCNSAVAKAAAKLKLLELGICKKAGGCEDLKISTTCG